MSRGRESLLINRTRVPGETVSCLGLTPDGVIVIVIFGSLVDPLGAVIEALPPHDDRPMTAATQTNHPFQGDLTS
jgi:hypothetical protein